MSGPVRIVRRAPSAYDVVAGGVRVGWFDDRTIALVGFDDAAAARRAGVAAYATAVGWHLADDARGPGLRLHDPGAVPAADRIEMGGDVVGRVVRAGGGHHGERFGFELARVPGQPFAASVHLVHRLLSVAAEAGLVPRPSHAGPAGAAEPAYAAR